MKSGEPIPTFRAQRFPYEIPLHYRKNGFTDWHECKTINISRTGILFQTDQTLVLNSPLEIRVQLPLSVTLTCRGSVVRTPSASCAVRIHHCHIKKMGAEAR